MFDDKTVRDMKKAIVRQYNDDDVKHDHPPMPVLVPWCPYCKKYGNVLAQNVVRS